MKIALRILAALVLAFILFYLWAFVYPKEITSPRSLSVRLIDNCTIDIASPDSYYYIYDVDTVYSLHRDTIYITAEYSTLGNIFASPDTTYNWMKIDCRTKTVAYCGIFRTLTLYHERERPIDTTSELGRLLCE